jgi:DNA-binding transcriptional ArsR family regulator
MLDLDRVLHALADPTRRALVERISLAEAMSAARLAEPLDISLAAVVQHLKILEECGVIRTEKVGRVRTCRLETEAFTMVEKWINDRRSLWERRFDRLGDLLGENTD